MNKTLHKKLTEKHLYKAPGVFPGANGLSDNFNSEIQLLKEAAGDLLKPRSQAIANLLKLAKAL